MAESLDLEVRSHRLHAVRHGSPAAPLVIGIHGLTGTSAQLERLGRPVAEAGLQLVALDLRGRGASAPTGPGTYGWSEHALDVLAVASALGAERVGLLGLSMGGSVAMKACQLGAERVAALVLLDVAGRVDPGIGPVVAAAMDGATADPDAVAEDRRSTLAEDPHLRWRHLTMPVLLVRATREMAPGSGFVVPAGERDRFLREVPGSELVEVDADHRTIADHPDTATAVAPFLARTLLP